MSEFHYNRAEREAMAGGRKETERGGVFRRNRALLITLLDLAVILIMFVLYIVFIRPNQGTAEIDGFAFRLHAFEYDARVYVSVEITAVDRTNDAGLVSGADSLVVATFPDGQEVTDVLPAAGSRIRIRHVLDDRSRSVAVDLEAAGETLRLSVPVAGED